MKILEQFRVYKWFEKDDAFYRYLVGPDEYIRTLLNSLLKTASSPNLRGERSETKGRYETMPAKLTLTAQDLKRGTLIEEASWYPIVITAVKAELARDKESTNVVVDAELLPSQDPAKNKYAGVPVRRYFSEKAPGMAKNYITACGVTIPEEGGEFDLEGSVGRQMEAYIKQRLDDNGRMQNDVVDFRPMKG